MIFPSIDHLENLSNSLQSAFIRVAKDEALWQSDLSGALRHLTASVAQALDVARVGVWLSHDEEPSIECVQQLLVKEGRFERGANLQAIDFPAYFRALAGGRLIDAADAINDYRTAEFALADTNKDGQLSTDELAAKHVADMTARAAEMAAKMIERSDENADGQLSAEEMANGPRAPTLFERVDADGDGAITKAEADAMKDDMGRHGKHHRRG